MIDLHIVDQGIALGVELHVSVMGRNAERPHDTYVVAAHKRRPADKLVSSEPMIARSTPQNTPNQAALEVLALIRQMPAPPNAEDIIAAKDQELAKLRQELEQTKEQAKSDAAIKPSGKKKAEQPTT